MSVDALMERRNAAFGAGAPLFYQTPVHIVRGEGVYLYDETGKQYIDMYNNVPCVGHANPHVVARMTEQLGTLNVHSRYLSEPIVEYAERLTGHHAAHIESAVFACSGTEANEVAMSMAQRVTGGTGFICSDAAYHGNSAQVGRLTHVGRRESEAEVRAFPYPQKYRPLRDNVREAELRDAYLAALDEQIDGLAADGIKLAGMLICPLFCNEGLPDVPEGFMAEAASRVRASGGVVISDEVQAGVCRSGSWWGYEVMGFEPDIVVMGKPIGNGMPLSAVCASREMVETFRKRGYFNTFASSPLQAAAGNAVLDVIENEGVRENVRDVGAHLRAGLEAVTANAPEIAEVRGHGLFFGLECVVDRESREPDRERAVELANALKDKGFLTSNAGALGNVLKMRPPLVYGREHADLFLVALEECLAG